jgi:hypothetical protein
MVVTRCQLQPRWTPSLNLHDPGHVHELEKSEAEESEGGGVAWREGAAAEAEGAEGGEQGRDGR